MVLEATIIVVDNSEHSRNGDYLPSRFEAQSDAVNMIFSAKTQANPESSVGLMTMGGSQPEVLTTLTNDFGKILEGMHRTKIKGAAHLSTALNVAGLALKHRQNKSQHQRIIVFTCSPVTESNSEIIKLAKRLKKININVDIIAFGDLDPSVISKLEAFNDNIKGTGDGSHLAVIPPGPNLLSDSIAVTPILAGEGVGMGAGGGGGGAGADNGFDFGVDPNNDPELALALRMSMEEEERRRGREQQEQAAADNKQPLETVPEAEEGGAAGSSTAPAEESANGEKKDGDHDKMDTA